MAPSFSTTLQGVLPGRYAGIQGGERGNAVAHGARGGDGQGAPRVREPGLRRAPVADELRGPFRVRGGGRQEASAGQAPPVPGVRVQAPLPPHQAHEGHRSRAVLGTVPVALGRPPTWHEMCGRSAVQNAHVSRAALHVSLQGEEGHETSESDGGDEEGGGRGSNAKERPRGEQRERSWSRERGQRERSRSRERDGKGSHGKGAGGGASSGRKEVRGRRRDEG